MDEELLHHLLFRELARHQGDKTHIFEIVNGIQRIAAYEDLFPSAEEAAKEGLDTSYYQQKRLNPQDDTTIRRLIWDCISQGMLVPGIDNASQSNLPWLTITPYGRSVVTRTEPTPYDPSRYFQAAYEAAKEIRPEIMMYLEEAIGAFRRGLFLSSAVMLGVASESAFLTLCKLISKKFQEQNEGQRSKKLTQARTLKEKQDLILSWIQSGVLKGLPDSERLQLHLQGAFSAIRLTRNEAGHPTGQKISREIALGHLTLFPQYLRTIADYMRFLKGAS